MQRVFYIILIAPRVAAHNKQNGGEDARVVNSNEIIGCAGTWTWLINGSFRRRRRRRRRRQTFTTRYRTPPAEENNVFVCVWV